MSGSELLTMRENTIASGILPLSFGPATAYGNFPSVILEVTPEEFEKIQNNELKLPNGWRVGDKIFSPLDAAFTPSDLLSASAGRTFFKLLRAAIDRVLRHAQDKR